jgi:TrmH family RNA methyltransferase
LIILVEPKFQGNVGACARAAKNFGIDDLVLVKPCEIGVEAEKRAMHGLDVLKAARSYEELESAIAEEKIDIVVGTSGVLNKDDRCYIRNPDWVEDFAKTIWESPGNVGLLFGREDFGLLVDELAKCDHLVSIPANPDYPILNLSHAVIIVLYELFKRRETSLKKVSPQKSTGMEKEKFIEHFKDLMEAVDYPVQKKDRAEVLFRRMVARSEPTKWEFHTLMGVFSKAIKVVDRGKTKEKQPHKDGKSPKPE